LSLQDKLRVVFFGTPEFVIPVLELLHKEEELVGVVTQPDKPQGRGLKPLPSPVKKWAQERGIPVLEPQKLKDETFLKALRNLNADLIVVFAYGKILPKEVLETPWAGCWNIHLSLLPRHRGASPVQWALLEGDKTTGVTIMLMDEGMDTGPILLQKEIEISEQDTTPTLLSKLVEISVDALKEALYLFKLGKLSPQKQSDEGVSYAPLIKREDGFTDFTEPAERIIRKIRAFQPWPGVFTKFKERILKIHSAEKREMFHEVEPGTILNISKEGILIATSKGALLLKELQLEGKKKISAYEFAIGQHLQVGEKLP